MISRFEIAERFKGSWPLLSWKGDEHTKGIYFDESYGYLIDRAHAVRIEHEEKASPVFYIPDLDTDEDEVITDYPYTKMSKATRKHHLLFQDGTLPPSQLDELFSMEPGCQFSVNPALLYPILESLPIKRIRDRSWIKLSLNGNTATAKVVSRQKDKCLISEIIEIIPLIGCNKEDNNFLYVNANALLHTLSLFNGEGNLIFWVNHDKIKITIFPENPRMDVVIATPKYIPDLDKEEPG